MDAATHGREKKRRMNINVKEVCEMENNKKKSVLMYRTIQVMLLFFILQGCNLNETTIEEGNIPFENNSDIIGNVVLEDEVISQINNSISI